MKPAPVALLAAALGVAAFACGPTPPGTSHPDGGTSDAGASDGGADAGGADGGALTDLARLNQLVAALPGAPGAQRQQLVADFMTAVAYGAHGFPIVEAGELGVAFYDSSNTPGALTLAGDFNGWDAAQLPLAQPVAGFPFYYLVTPLTPPSVRSLYKLVRDGATWFADPMARRYGHDQNGEYSLLEAGAAQSHLERWPGFALGSGTLAPRTVRVYAPAGAPPAGGYRVLYLQDGENVFDPSAAYGGWHCDDAADQAIAGGMAPFLMVAVDNTPARMDEYTQSQDDVGTGGLVGGRAADYVAFLADGVKPFVDARYPTKPGPADTGVAGSSLGGLVSVYAVVARPDVFGHGASLSGTFGWGSIGAGIHNPTMMDLFKQHPPAGATFYVDSGGGPGSGCVDSDGDGVRDDTADSSDNYCENLDMVDAMTSQGWAVGTTIDYKWTSGATHDEAAWAARFPGVLTGWFPGP